MASAATTQHAVCIPLPVQGHINAMLELAKLLHSKGFHVTFVHTEFNYKRILKCNGPSCLEDLDDFRIATIPDGLPPSDDDSESRDLQSLCVSIQRNFAAPFQDLVTRLNDSYPQEPSVTCIVSDVIMTFTYQASKHLCIPNVSFYSSSACGSMGVLHYKQLIDRGLTPLKSESDLVNGYLDTPVDWIPGMKNIRLKDIPSFIRTTDPDDIFLNFMKDETERVHEASAVIINTFDDLEKPVLEAMSQMLPPVYTVGPLCLLSRQIPESQVASSGYNLWKEEVDCLEWLEGREPGSVLYVNFGSLAILTTKQLIEFAWGLANSGYNFLWVIRPDLVIGQSAVLPHEFMQETKGRSLFAGWCPQERVLLHPSIGGFLTHGGWNSILESICGGVPMICWPFFGDQQTNCRYMYSEWGIGMEINNDVKREEVESLVRELMGGEKGKEMRRMALHWKERAMEATKKTGKSSLNLERVINEVLLRSK